MHRLKERLTYGNVVATIALFVALGGSSYAAITLPRNSVGANQIRTGAVRSSEVKDKSLNARDLSTAARTFLKGRTGPRGPQGPTGPTGPPGNGPGGPNQLVLTYETSPGTINAGEVGGGTATCGANRRVVAGGARVESASDTSIRESYPNINNTAWTVRLGNDDDPVVKPGPFNFTVFAICAG
jgi:hypothetical protein